MKSMLYLEASLTVFECFLFILVHSYIALPESQLAIFNAITWILLSFYTARFINNYR